MMMTRSLAAAAVATLMLSPAMAQTQTAPAPGAQNQTPPAAAAQTRANTGASVAFTDMQKQSQWLGSQLIGTKVVNSADESIGEINDLLVDDTGMVQAAVIGVGGFLGLGEKDVAVSFKDLKVTRQNDGDIERVSVNYTKDQLKQAPEFKTVADQRSNRSTTTGSTGTNAAPPAATSPSNQNNNNMKK